MSRQKRPVPAQDRPPAAKRPLGRSPQMVLKTDDTPENAARSMFGVKRKNAPKQPDDSTKPSLQ